MRIITGKYKGRSFDVPRSFKARPTTDFAKENLFNVLRQYVELEDSEALDLFSGTGSITLEMLSRGCSNVISVEMDRDHHRFIVDCLKKLSSTSGSASLPCTPLRADVFQFLKKCRLQFDFIFADPPYQLQNLASLPGLVVPKLLKPNGVFVLEHGKNYDFSNEPLFIDHREYGSVNFSIFKAVETSV